MTDQPQPSLPFWEPQVPFVACRSEGGPYDDEAFVAGVNLGRLWAEMEALAARTTPATAAQITLPAALDRQADLLAMMLGLVYSSTPVPAGPDQVSSEWVLVRVSRPARDGLQL